MIEQPDKERWKDVVGYEGLYQGIEVGRYNGVREACEKNGYKRGRLDSILYNSNSRIFDNFIWILV